mgnify:CR=1 FL=1
MYFRIAFLFHVFSSADERLGHFHVLSVLWYILRRINFSHFQLQKFKYFADDISKLDKADRFCYEVSHENVAVDFFCLCVLVFFYGPCGMLKWIFLINRNISKGILSSWRGLKRKYTTQTSRQMPRLLRDPRTSLQVDVSRVGTKCQCITKVICWGFFFPVGAQRCYVTKTSCLSNPEVDSNTVVFRVIWCARNLKKILWNTGPLKATARKTIPEGPRTNYFNFFFRWVKCPGINSV